MRMPTTVRVSAPPEKLGKKPSWKVKPRGANQSRWGGVSHPEDREHPADKPHSPSAGKRAREYMKAKKRKDKAECERKGTSRLGCWCGVGGRVVGARVSRYSNRSNNVVTCRVAPWGIAFVTAQMEREKKEQVQERLRDLATRTRTGGCSTRRSSATSTQSASYSDDFDDASSISSRTSVVQAEEAQISNLPSAEIPVTGMQSSSLRTLFEQKQQKFQQRLELMKTQSDVSPVSRLCTHIARCCNRAGEIGDVVASCTFRV